MFAGRRADDVVYAAPASLWVIVLGSCVGVVGASSGRDGVSMYVSLCGVFKEDSFIALSNLQMNYFQHYFVRYLKTTLDFARTHACTHAHVQFSQWSVVEQTKQLVSQIIGYWTAQDPLSVLCVYELWYLWFCKPLKMCPYFLNTDWKHWITDALSK